MPFLPVHHPNPHFSSTGYHGRCPLPHCNHHHHSAFLLPTPPPAWFLQRSQRDKLQWDCQAELFRQEQEDAGDIRLNVRLFQGALGGWEGRGREEWVGVWVYPCMHAWRCVFTMWACEFVCGVEGWGMVHRKPFHGLWSLEW